MAQAPVESGDSEEERPEMRFCTDLEKFVLLTNFERRGWVRGSTKSRGAGGGGAAAATATTSSDDSSDHDDGGRERASNSSPWNFYWCSVHTVHMMFSADSKVRLKPDQMINHFPNHAELTRKDLMVKNIKRYRHQMEREGNPMAEKNADGSFMYLDFLPTTFILPGDYNLFVEHFKRSPNTVWILKPTSKACGVGISLVNRLSQLKKFAATGPGVAVVTGKDAFVISRYLEKPLLIGGRKFDLRLYVLVTSFKPLRAYFYRLGFCRFCAAKYKDGDTNNMYVHLTNVSIQKQGEEYNDTHGGKWSLENLRLHLVSIHGQEVWDKLMDDTYWQIIHSLKSVQPVMNSDRHCFEIYGFDIFLTEDFKPWLIEVNASPSLSFTTVSDRIMKTSLIHDTFGIIAPKGVITDVRGPIPPVPDNLGLYDLLYNEEAVWAAEGKGPKAKDVNPKAAIWRS